MTWNDTLHIFAHGNEHQVGPFTGPGLVDILRQAGLQTVYEIKIMSCKAGGRDLVQSIFDACKRKAITIHSAFGYAETTMTCQVGICCGLPYEIVGNSCICGGITCCGLLGPISWVASVPGENYYRREIHTREIKRPLPGVML